MRPMITACAVFLSVAAVARADEPVGVILEVSGTTTPMVEIFDEIRNGQTISLMPDTVVELSDYATCSEYTIKGGKIAIEDDQIKIEDNAEVNLALHSCISNASLAKADLISAGIVTRSSAAGLPMISPRPSFGIAGVDSEKFDTLSIRIGDATIMRTKIEGRWVRYPVEAPFLELGQEAIVILSGPGVQQRAVRVQIAADAGGTTILR